MQLNRRNNQALKEEKEDTQSLICSPLKSMGKILLTSKGFGSGPMVQEERVFVPKAGGGKNKGAKLRVGGGKGNG